MQNLSDLPMEKLQNQATLEPNKSYPPVKKNSYLYGITGEDGTITSWDRGLAEPSRAPPSKGGPPRKLTAKLQSSTPKRKITLDYPDIQSATEVEEDDLLGHHNEILITPSGSPTGTPAATYAHPNLPNSSTTGNDRIPNRSPPTSSRNARYAPSGRGVPYYQPAGHDHDQRAGPQHIEFKRELRFQQKDSVAKSLLSQTRAGHAGGLEIGRAYFPRSRREIQAWEE